MEKKASKLTSIPGTKLALKNTQLLISSGISSLDDLIGGGIPVGTVFLIQEDSTGIYSKVMLRYFLAEGVVNKHSLHVISQDCDPKSFIKNLPEVIQTEEINTPGLNTEDDKLVIAWRYKNMKTDPKLRSTFSHSYDLTKVMSQSLIDNCDISYNDCSGCESNLGFKNSAYASVLKNIRQVIEEKGYLLTANPVKGNILRIVVHSVGSPLWLSENSDKNNDLNMFFYYLRAIARSAFVVIAVTIPTILINSDNLNSITHSSDIAIQLDSFSGTELEKNVALSDYQGFFKFKKFHAINCLKNCDPGPTDFVFKLRRKKFVIEMLHLPPDLQESTDEPVSTGCGGSRKLEF